MRAFIIALALSVLLAGINAAAAQTSHEASALAMMHGYFGKWQCVLNGRKVSVTFSPIFGGHGMRIDGGDPANQEADQVYFDGKRDRWIYLYMDAGGNYAMMEGIPAANQIRFTQMYPNGGMHVLVTNVTPRKYTETESMNGRLLSSNTCVKT